MTTSESVDGFHKPEYEFHQIKSSESKFLKSGESIRIKSNIIVTECVGDNAGFLTISRNPQNYWLGSVVNECFLIKSGVLSSDFVGVLHISVINKSTNPVFLKAGTNLGVLEFSKFI